MNAEQPGDFSRGKVAMELGLNETVLQRDAVCSGVKAKYYRASHSDTKKARR
jgi:hypothetical protein